MVGKVSERVLLRQGLERTDNGMKQTSWPDVAPINQKNYYTDYMKRDDQILSVRLANEAARERMIQSARDRDRALNNLHSEVPLPMDDAQADDTPNTLDPSKTIVVHPGSQNLRIGFASDTLPRTIPMVMAYKYPQTEAEMHEAIPRRQFEARTNDQEYGEEWSKRYQKMSNDLKIDMRANKRKVLPNSKDLVVNFNRRTEPEVISQHNDPLQIEWTEVNTKAGAKNAAGTDNSALIGNQAMRIPDDSNPKYKLFWPVQHGWLNEDDYESQAHLFSDLENLIARAIRWELGLRRDADWGQHSLVFVIPDLYDKRYVEQTLYSAIEGFGFGKISFIQESIAATFGAGYTQACVVDVGAQKTSIACVEDGMCMDDSRVNLKYGGYDVTETFIKMMLYDNLPYQEINLRRRYDFLLAEELKIKYCTLTQATISVQNGDFHVRAPNQPTRKYQFKYYDEVILAPMGFYEPQIFDNSTKLRGRRKLVGRSCNAYDVEMPDDPTSAAQLAILEMIQPSIRAMATLNGNGPLPEFSTPSKEKSQSFNVLYRGAGTDATPAGSNAASPAPEGSSTPAPVYYFGGSRDAINGGSPAPSGRTGGTPAPGPLGNGTANGGATAAGAAVAPPPGMFVEGGGPARPSAAAAAAAAEREAVLAVAPLDVAILTSIQNAAKGDEKKVRELVGSIMVIGGGAKTPHFTAFLEERLRAKRPDLQDRILVGRSAREMDEQVVVWKGASVFAKLPTNDSWITEREVRALGTRAIYNKMLWNY